MTKIAYADCAHDEEITLTIFPRPTVRASRAKNRLPSLYQPLPAHAEKKRRTSVVTLAALASRRPKI
jgi:hypothetical protein